MRLLLQADNRRLEAAIPLQRRAGFLSINFSIQLGEVSWAREVKLARYAMYGIEVLEELPGWPHLPLLRVLQALTNAFLCVGAGGNVEETLIGFRVL